MLTQEVLITKVEALLGEFATDLSGCLLCL